MRRGLDGFFLPFWPACSFQASPALRSRTFSVAIARGKHLFPFRTEPLSPSAPMVLGGQLPGRVGRRRSLTHEAASRGGFTRSGVQGAVGSLSRVALDRRAEVRA